MVHRNRKLTFFSICETLATKLQSLFVPLISQTLNAVCSVLREINLSLSGKLCSATFTIAVYFIMYILICISYIKMHCRPRRTWLFTDLEDLCRSTVAAAKLRNKLPGDINTSQMLTVFRR